MPALDARAEGAQPPGPSRGSGEHATPTSADGGGPSSASPGRQLGSIALVTTQLALTLLVIHQFHLESRTFFQVMLLASAGFVVHALLPMRHRLAFFVLLSVASVTLALGLRDGSFVILLGLALIGVCHLPVRMPVRVGLLVAIGTVFAFFRAGVMTGPWSAAIWPSWARCSCSGSSSTSTTCATRATPPYARRRRSRYFFMLPNVCFPLFPVVDYKTFRRTYYDDDALRDLPDGHALDRARARPPDPLPLRLLLPDARARRRSPSLGDLVQYLVANFLLYLRVSGQFHLIVGMLHLFGFNLPETHHRYFLASSFTDFWRRINIYWKDFMMKVFYYPGVLPAAAPGARRRRSSARDADRLRRHLAAALLPVVLAARQLPRSPAGRDLLGRARRARGVELALRDEARPRAHAAVRRADLASASLALAGRSGPSRSICVLWSLWTAESLSEWLALWTAWPAPSQRPIRG